MIQAPNQRDVVVIPVPVGSVEEVRALDENLLLTVATCSCPKRYENMGCGRWADCDFEWKGTRPQEVACEINKPDGSVVVSALHCRDAIHLRENMHINKGYVHFLGGTGTKWELHGSKRLHPKVDPSCPECVAGKCNVYIENYEPMEIPPFPAAADHPELAKFKNRLRNRRERRSEESTGLEQRFYGRPVNQPVGAKEEGGKDAEKADAEGGGPGSRGERAGRPRQAPAAGKG